MKKHIETNDNEQIGGYEFASKITGISKNTLYALVFKKRIPHIKLNRRFIRFSKNDLECWLVNHKIEPRVNKRLK